MSWIIQRREPAGNGHRTYLARPNGKKSYTTSKEAARTFPDKETAQRNCCGNEFPVDRGW